MNRNHYIAINAYRSSTDPGYGNTWTIYRCTAEQQRRLLSEGLPVRDQVLLNADGSRSPSYSTQGIRTLTAAERAQARRRPEMVEDYTEARLSRWLAPRQ